MKKFYIVNTYTGREKKVKEMLEKLIKEEGKEEFFGRIILPVKKVTRLKKSEFVVEEKRLYPGYIAVEMEESEEAFKLINSIPGVANLLGTANHPTPLTDDEVKSIIEEMERDKEKVIPEAPFNKGEIVKVIKGPFAGFTGAVEEVFPDRRRIRMSVMIFGRPTPIEIDFLEVEGV